MESLTGMRKRTLGNSGLEVSPLCFGGNVFGWTVDEPTSFRLLDSFTGAGFNFIDTADMYSRWVPGNEGGESETILGRWLKASGQRTKLVIATKVGKEMGPGKRGLSRRYIESAVDASLRRLQTDYIDLYQSHDDDTETPLEETLETYAGLIRSGKVRAIGASNYSMPRLQQALDAASAKGLPRYECLQPLYNLYDREVFESELEPFCLRHAVGVIPYFSLASGFLTGKYRSEADLVGQARGERVRRYLTPRGLRIVEALDEVAETLDTTTTTVALAWLIARPSVTAPIASASRPEQMSSLIDSTRLELPAACVQKLDAASRLVD